jgi:hypothetical protein
MASPVNGFTRDELVNHIKVYVGNTSQSFVTWLQDAVWMAEQRYCKANDWSFLRKKNLRLAVTSGTQYYKLEPSTIGFYMRATNVENVWSVEQGRYLKRVELEDIRRRDADENDGDSASGNLLLWAPAGGDNEIAVYPRIFSNLELRLDGIITPTPIMTGSAYFTIPVHYQDAFVEYVKALALDRENDARANAQKNAALAMIRQDIAADKANLGATDTPRIKDYWEQGIGGSPANDALYMALFWNLPE